MRSTRVRLGLLVAMLAIAGGSATTAAWLLNVLASGEEPSNLVADLDVAAPMPDAFAPQPQALPAGLCDDLRPVAIGLWDANVEAADQSGMASEALEEYRDRLDDALDRTEDWLDAGCPADGVLGAYERLDGGPAVVRLLDWPPPDVALTFVPAGTQPASADADRWFGTDRMQ